MEAAAACPAGTSEVAAAALTRRSGGGGNSAVDVVQPLMDSVILAAATLDGLLYEFRVTDISSRGGGVSGGPSRGGGGGSVGGGPRALLEGEWALLGSNSL
jgi:hypothetical protein